MSKKGDFVFRRAKREDIKVVQQMIQELADFEKMSDGPQLTEQDLIRDAGLDGDRDYCHIYLLELAESANPEPTVVGYAICFFSYSSWQGRAYFLQDLYVRPAYRRRGTGACIFREIAAKAQEHRCKRVDFHVHAWNPAREFYKKMGAVDLTATDEWHCHRVGGDQFAKLTSELLPN